MGALTLAASLKRVNPSRKLAIMVTSEGWFVFNVIIMTIIFRLVINRRVAKCILKVDKLCLSQINSNFSVFPCLDCTERGL